MKDGLWSFADGSEPRLEVPGASANSQTIKAYREYKAKMDKALAIIVLAVDQTLLYLLGEPTDPQIVWSILENQFIKNSWSNKLALFTKLLSTKLYSPDQLEGHIRAMVQNFNDLSTIGCPLEEEDKVIWLLASIKEAQQFTMVVTAFETLPSVPSMETVFERLRHEASKYGLQKMDDSALIHKQRRAANTGAHSYSGFECYYCKEEGHMKRNCPKLNRKNIAGSHKMNSGKSKHENANIATDEFESEESAFTVCQAGNINLALVASTNSWILDSGATSHLCGNQSSFLEIKDHYSRVTIGDGHEMGVTGIGKIQIFMNLPDGTKRKTILHNVLYVPDLAFNLISVSKVTAAGYKISFDDNQALIKNGAGILRAVAKRVNSLYLFDADVLSGGPTTQCLAVSEDLWHARFGHLHESALQTLAKDELVNGFDYNQSKKLSFCEACTMGKMHRLPFPKSSESRSNEILELVHSDLSGKITPPSKGGAQYFMTIIDDKSRFTWIFMLKRKEEAYKTFCNWKAQVEKSFGLEVKKIRSDNGGEYTSSEFEEFLKSEGIQHHKTIPKTPEQNGVAERMNRTLVEMTRSIMYGMDVKLWGEAINTSVYIRNRCPTSSVPGKTPYEVLHNTKPEVSHMRPFGCVCYAHVAKDERTKLECKARKCIFLGYGETVKGYRVLDVENNKIFYSRDILFRENVRPGSEMNNDGYKNDDSEPFTIEGGAEITDDVHQSASYERPQRTRNKPNWMQSGEYVFIDDATMAETTSHNISGSKETTPTTYNEAIRSDHAAQWQEAIQSEYHSLIKNEAWDLVDLPEGKHVIGSKWVFKVKYSANGEIDRYKARLVAQGFRQKKGQDYDETFSPVVRPESVRALVAYAIQKGMLIHQLDIATAFLNGDLEEDVFMTQPEGFTQNGQEKLVCKLNKSLYGLKQSPRCWNTALDKTLNSHGFTQTPADPCIYVDEAGSIIAVYVDDLIPVAQNMDVMSKIKSFIMNQYEARDLGELSYFLGINVQKTPDGGMWMGQCGYIADMLSEFNMSMCNAVDSPMVPGAQLEFASTSKEIDQKLYQSAIGKLLYVSNWTRPDITFAVNTLARYCSNPCLNHWLAVKRVLRYLKGTSDFGLVYSMGDSKAVGFSDSDWAGSLDDRKSTSGYLFLFGQAPISWKSKRQTCVALSSAEAEYVALAACAQEAAWQRELFKSMVHESEYSSIVINTDSQSAMAMASKPAFHGRAKHIDIKYHFIREEVLNKKVVLVHCPTDLMLADILTKPLTTIKHNTLRKMLNVRSATMN